MRFPISSAAVGLALIAGAPVAQAQTMITSGPMVTYPAATVVQTTETVRTVRPGTHFGRRQVVTTRTITRQFVPARTVMARTFATSQQQPLYDEVTPAPYAAGPRPLYDEVVSAPDAAAPAYSETYTYRYVYEPDRILVIDPNTGVAIQAIPR
jgi:hypothetical protein